MAKELKQLLSQGVVVFSLRHSLIIGETSQVLSLLSVDELS